MVGKQMEEQKQKEAEMQYMPHTCILRLNPEELEKYENFKRSKIDEFTKKEDTNLYRRVSKYELDNMTVDWQKLMKEKEKQQTFNNGEGKKVVGKRE